MMDRRKLAREDAQEVVLRALDAGLTVTTAADCAGVTRRTVYNWRKRDADFAAQMDLALATAEVSLAERVREAAEHGSWRAAAWLLERRWPERWGAPERGLREIDGPPVHLVFASSINELPQVHRPAFTSRTANGNGEDE